MARLTARLGHIDVLNTKGRTAVIIVAGIPMHSLAFRTPAKEANPRETFAYRELDIARIARATALDNVDVDTDSESA